MPTGRMDLDPGSLRLIYLSQILEDELWMGILRIGFQESILALKDIRGCIEVLLREMSRKNTAMSSPSRMKGLRPGTGDDISEGS